MNLPAIFGKLLLLAFLFSIPIRVNSQQRPELYHLKSYTLADREQEMLTEFYLEESYLPALKRQGIRRVGVFKKHISETDSLRQIYVLYTLYSLNQLQRLEEALLRDKLHMKDGAPYFNATHDKPAYLRIESTLLKAFKEMPVMKPYSNEGPREQRIYELRSYESASEGLYRNKVAMFNAGGEIKLFDKLGFNAVFYAEVLSGAHMPNLMYMTTFKDRETRDSLWEQFFASDKWKELEANPVYQNNVSHADIILLYPTPYSDY